jgi:ribose-phosphate pyrophosphokinase
MHAGQVEGFADVPIENFSALPLLTKAIAEKYKDQEFVVALPDEGMGKRLKDDKTRSIIAENLGPGTTFLQMAKDRIEVNEVNSAHIKEGKVNLSGKIVLILDDMIDTGKTTRLAARVLLQAGATKVIAAATLGIFSGDAIESFRNDRELVHGRLVRPVSEIFVTDSISLRRAAGDLVHVVTLADYLGDIVHSLATKDSRSLKEIMLAHSGRGVM